MSELMLARWQFGITSTYHFLFVPLTLGLSVLVALLEGVGLLAIVRHLRTSSKKSKPRA